MDHLATAVRQALDQQNWYAALGLALTLPDICGRLESPTERSKARYVRWCNRYLSPHYSFAPSESDPQTRVMLHGEDCYALRCAVLHEGADAIVEQQARRALDAFRFLIPDSGGLWVRQGGLLQLPVDAFCERLCDGVDDWLEDVQGDPEVVTRIGSLMKVHEGVRIHVPSRS